MEEEEEERGTSRRRREAADAEVEEDAEGAAGKIRPPRTMDPPRMQGTDLRTPDEIVFIV